MARSNSVSRKEIQQQSDARFEMTNAIMEQEVKAAGSHQFVFTEQTIRLLEDATASPFITGCLNLSKYLVLWRTPVTAESFGSTVHYTPISEHRQKLWVNESQGLKTKAKFYDLQNEWSTPALPKGFNNNLLGGVDKFIVYRAGSRTMVNPEHHDLHNELIVCLGERHMYTIRPRRFTDMIAVTVGTEERKMLRNELWRTHVLMFQAEKEHDLRLWDTLVIPDHVTCVVGCRLVFVQGRGVLGPVPDGEAEPICPTSPEY